MSEIRGNQVDQRTYESNAQMLGAQRDTVRRKDLAKTAAETSEPGDQVELGQGAGAHTGAAQDLSGEARRLSATRTAMSNGTVRPGTVAPGETSEGATQPAAEGAGQPQGAPSPPPQPQAGGAMPPGGMPPGGMPPGGMPPGGMPPGGMPYGGVPYGAVPPYGGRTATQAATAAQQAQFDAQQAQTIYAQMAADRQKALMEMWKIFQDLQTAIFQKMQDVMSYRQEVMNKVSAKWSEVLRG